MLEFHNCNLINYPNVWKENSYFRLYTWSKTESHSHGILLNAKLKKAVRITNKPQCPWMTLLALLCWVGKCSRNPHKLVCLPRFKAQNKWPEDCTTNPECTGVRLSSLAREHTTAMSITSDGKEPGATGLGLREHSPGCNNVWWG